MKFKALMLMLEALDQFIMVFFSIAFLKGSIGNFKHYFFIKLIVRFKFTIIVIRKKEFTKMKKWQSKKYNLVKIKEMKN